MLLALYWRQHMVMAMPMIMQDRGGGSKDVLWRQSRVDAIDVAKVERAIIAKLVASAWALWLKWQVFLLGFWAVGLHGLTGEAWDFKGFGAGKVSRHQLKHCW